MKHILTSMGAVNLSVCVLLTSVVWWIFPEVRSSALAVFLMFFGLVNLSIQTVSMDKNKYRSVIFPHLLPFGFWITLMNLFLFGSAVKIAGTDPVFVPMQIPFWVFAALTTTLSLAWYVAVSKLTPKPGTMVVDEETDLYYLPGEVLPRLSPWVKIITPETKIPISVSGSIPLGPTVTVSQTFCFSAWVFKQDARNELPGSMYFHTNINAAQNKFFGVMAEKIKTIADIGKFFEPGIFPIPRNPSPYVWNDDLKVVVEKRK